MKYLSAICFFNRSIYFISLQSYQGEVAKDDFIIIKSNEFAEEVAKVSLVDQDPPDGTKWQEGVIVRKANHKDLERFRQLRRKSFDALEKCREALESQELEMNLVDAFFSFDNQRLSFFFTAEGRVDFREFVKDLAGRFQKRILLLQIGPRDKAKHVGGFGICGREVCCKNFLNSLKSINMDMARIQGISSWGSSKLSGQCEKLKCCLAYEEESYQAVKKKLPKEGEIVHYQGKSAKVISVDLLNQRLKISLEGEESSFTVEADELKFKENGKQH